MAKNKRKPSASQRDKVAIETAKILKKKGVLSKQTKLHGGRYISRSVLKKVQELQFAAKPDYTALKVKPAIAHAARAEGYSVTGNRVIVPREHDFIKRVKAGMISGIKPVKGGVMSEVKVDFEGKNISELLSWLDERDLDSLKMNEEQFAFRLSGPEGSPHGMSYRAFPTTQSLKDYFQHYKPDIEATGFKLFRLHPEDVRKFIKSPNERKRLRGEHKRKSRKGPGEKPRGHSPYRARMERLEKTNPAKAEQIRKASAERSKKRYEKQKRDPEYMRKQRERGLRRYYERKGK